MTVRVLQAHQGQNAVKGLEERQGLKTLVKHPRKRIVLVRKTDFIILPTLPFSS